VQSRDVRDGVNAAWLGLLTRHDSVNSFANFGGSCSGHGHAAIAMVSHSAVTAACAVRENLVAQQRCLSVCRLKRSCDAILVCLVMVISDWTGTDDGGSERYATAKQASASV